MKDYKRFTFRQEGEWAIKASNGAMSIIFADDVYYIGKAIDHFADLENKIKRGEIDYVEAKDKKIAQLIAERDKWKRRVEVAERAGKIIQRNMFRVFGTENPTVNARINGLWDLALQQAEREIEENALRQAAREIEEERK